MFWILRITIRHCVAVTYAKVIWSRTWSLHPGAQLRFFIELIEKFNVFVESIIHVMGVSMKNGFIPPA